MGGQEQGGGTNSMDAQKQTVERQCEYKWGDEGEDEEREVIVIEALTFGGQSSSTTGRKSRENQLGTCGFGRESTCLDTAAQMFWADLQFPRPKYTWSVEDSFQRP